MKKIKKIFLSFMLSYIVVAITGCNNREENSKKSIQTAETNDNSEVDSSNKDYTAETSYNGGTVPGSLYQIPFKKSESYVKNADLIKQMNEEQVEKYLSSAETYVSTLFGADYRTILNDQEAFLESIKNLYGSGIIYQNGETISPKKRAQQLMEWYVDHSVQMKAEFVTDKSLLYEDNYSYYLRGMLTLTMYGDNASDSFKEIYGIHLVEKQPVDMICEISFSKGDEPNITEFSILDQEEE